MRLRYAVAIVPEADGKGYYAVVPSLPGCFSQGETVEAAERHVAEAITLHVKGLRRSRRPVPQEVRSVYQTVVSVVA